MALRGFQNVVALVLVLVFLMPWIASCFSFCTTGESATANSTSTSLLFDNFTKDSSLNSSLWQINGPVGTLFGPAEVGVNIVTLEPAFSSAGMEIAQVNASQEVGTIQTLESFTPPFTATAVAEGTVSNGHTFGFALANANASSGVVVYGNLNSTNCSHLGDCGDPSICGNPANSSIAPNQCFYGIDDKIGNGSGNWVRGAKLYLTPSVNVIYTLQIAVSATGSAQYSVSQGGSILGQSTTQVGTGPFYLILEQGEGSPVLSPGPNQAYWISVSVTNSPALVITSTVPSSSQSVSSFDWLIVIVVVLVLVISLWYSRRRVFTIEVEDSQSLSPVFGAAVFADGPEKLSGSTGKNGRVNFGSAKSGDYSIRATAGGYTPSVTRSVHVGRRTSCNLRLDRISQATAPDTMLQGGQNREFVGTPPIADTGSVENKSSPPVQKPRMAVDEEGVVVKQQEVPSSTPGETGELEGWGGERIRQIIKTFQDKGAVSPETALTAQELGLSRLFVRIMKRRQGKTRVFIEIGGRYYLNEKALHEMT